MAKTGVLFDQSIFDHHSVRFVGTANLLNTCAWNLLIGCYRTEHHNDSLHFLTFDGGSSCQISSADIFPSWCSTSLAALSPASTAPSM